MLKFIGRTLLQFLLILFCVTFLSFLLLYLAPGDPAESILSAQGIPYSKELLELKRIEFGLNGSFLEQYLNWLGRIVRGDFGVTYNSGASVLDQLVFYFPNSLYLGFWILVATVGVSVPSALFAAYRVNSRLDRLMMSLLAFLNAVPSFVLGIVLIIVFSVHLHWFPVQSTAGQLGLILPIVTVAITMSTRYIPQLRTAFLEELRSPVVEGSRGRGIKESRILFRDVLYNTLPFLLTLVGLSLGSLIGGIAIIENLFSWPGVGKLMISIASNRDYPLIQGVVLFTTTGVLFVNLLFQILTVWFNPRTRLADADIRLLTNWRRKGVQDVKNKP